MATRTVHIVETPCVNSSNRDYQPPIYPKFHRTQSTPNACMQPLQRIQMLEAENRRLMTNQGQLVQETNRRVEMHLNEIRMLKDENKRMNTENNELRDLCCFLDDDRQRTKRLSREWQRFGRYTANVMKQEVTAYQEKLKELETKQTEFVSENSELKQLCLYLDEQRGARNSNCPNCGANLNIPQTVGSPENNSTGSRDDGDGSSGRSSDSENQKPESDRTNFPLIPGATPKLIKVGPLSVQVRNSRPVVLERKAVPPDDHNSWMKLNNGQKSDFNAEFLTNNSGGSTTARPSLLAEKPRSLSMIAIPEQSGAENNTNLNKSEPGLMSYVRSLEERVKQLETNQLSLSASASGIFSHDFLISSPILSPSESGTNMLESAKEIPSADDPLVASQQSNGSSVGTSVTYGSSGSDSPVTALYMQEDMEEGEEEDKTGFEDRFSNGESSSGSTLTPIEEADELEPVESPESVSESSFDTFDVEISLNHLPRRQLLDSARLSYSEPTNLNEENTQFPRLQPSSYSGPLFRHSSLVSVQNKASGPDNGACQWPSVAEQGKSLSEALKVLEIQEMANSRLNGEMTNSQKAIINKMCSVVWKSIDEQDVTRSSSSKNSTNPGSSNLTMTAL